MANDTFFVEATDDGAIITKYGREYNYNCPTGSTLTFECHNFYDAMMLTKWILGGRKGMRAETFDMVVEVNKIYPYVKGTAEDFGDDEEFEDSKDMD